MKRIWNIGSLNIDYVYSVDHIFEIGETVDSLGMEVFVGGKGLNQSIALARAGAEVVHCGCVGKDSEALLKALTENRVDTTMIQQLEIPNGHAIIQLDKAGRNSILLYGGSNQAITKEYIDEVFSKLSAEDGLLLQNEISQLPYILEKAAQQQIPVILNPSPINEALAATDLSMVSWFILNEIELEHLTGEADPLKGLAKLYEKYPQTKIIVTLGKEGAVYFDGEETYRQSIFEVVSKDTTAAGDTFTGYFFAAILAGEEVPTALRNAAAAAALAVTEKGASNSIPVQTAVQRFIQK